MTLDVRVEDLDGRLHEAASRKVLLVLDEREPGLQQLVVGLHVDHVVFVQLGEREREHSHRLLLVLPTHCGSEIFHPRGQFDPSLKSFIPPVS